MYVLSEYMAKNAKKCTDRQGHRGVIQNGKVRDGWAKCVVHRVGHSKGDHAVFRVVHLMGGGAISLGHFEHVPGTSRTCRSGAAE